MKAKDVIILRLYLTFMGLEEAEEAEDLKFLFQCSEFMSDCGDNLNDLMDPEKSFLISSENNKRIKELLVNLQKEKLTDDVSRSEHFEEEDLEYIENFGRAQKVVEIFTNILFEALQFVNIIPNVAVHDLMNEIDEMRKGSDGYNQVKNNLIDFKNMVS